MSFTDDTDEPPNPVQQALPWPGLPALYLRTRSATHWRAPYSPRAETPPAEESRRRGAIDLVEPRKPGAIDIWAPRDFTPPLPPLVAQARAMKASYGLGQADPQPLVESIQSGQEMPLREAAASAQDRADEKLRQTMMMDFARKTKRDLSPEEKDVLYSMSSDFLSLPEFKNKPETIFENAYAHKLMGEAIHRADAQRSLAQDAADVFPGAVADTMTIGANVVAKREGFQRIHEDAGARYGGTSWFSWGVDQAFGLIPGYIQYELWGAAKQAPTNSIFTGERLHDKVGYFWRIADPVRAQTEFKAEVDRLFDIDPSIALKFSNAVVNYAHSDRVMDNVMMGVDALFIAQGLKAAARVPGALLRANAARKVAGETATTAENLVKTATEIGAEAGATAPAAGTTRLFRVESSRIGPNTPTPEWLKQGQAIEGVDAARGRWFAADEENLRWYEEHARKNGEVSHRTYIDVPTQDVEKYRVSGLPKDSKPRQFSRRPEEEFFVSPELAASAKPHGLAPETLPGHPATSDPLDTAVNVIAATTDAAVAPGPGVAARVAAATGQGDAATMAAVEGIMEGTKIGAKDPTNFGRAVLEATPMVANVLKVVGTYADLVTARGQRIANILTQNAINLASSMENIQHVRRALDKVYIQVGFKEAFEAVKKNYNDVQHAIINIGHETPYQGILPGGLRSPAGQIVVAFGKKDGSLFESLADAQYWAQQYGFTSLENAEKFGGTNIFKVGDQTSELIQAGNGYYIKVVKHVDETTDAFRNALIVAQGESPTSWGTSLLGAIRNPQEFLAKLQIENRDVATHSAQALAKHIEAIYKNANVLSVKKLKDGTSEYSRMRSILEENHRMPHPTDAKRTGYYYENVSDYEKAYQTRFNQVPSEKEITSYFSYIALNDQDFILRNAGVFRDKTIMGLEDFSFRYSFVNERGELIRNVKMKNFDGKIVDDIPWSATGRKNILIHDSQTGTSRVLDKSLATAEDKAELAEKIKDGYKYIEVHEPGSKPFASLGGDIENIHYALVKDVEHGPISFQQVPYRAGGHADYRQSFYLKQGRVTRIGEGVATRHIYEGDTPFLSFNTQAQAARHLKSAETARTMMNLNTPGLAHFLQRNLGMDEAYFRDLFVEKINPTTGAVEKAIFHPEDPFELTDAGRRILDTNKKMPERYKNFEDASSSASAQRVNKKFLGARGDEMQTLREIQDADGVLFKREMAKELDPFAAMISGLQGAIRHQNFSDYKIQAIEHWIQEYHDILPVGRGGLTAAENLKLLREDPVYFMHNAKVDSTLKGIDRDRAAVAMAQQKAIINFLGTESELQKDLSTLSNRLQNMVYNTFGEKASDYLAEANFSLLRDPGAFMRAVAFHPKLGMFNPVQFILQAQSLGHIVSLAGPTTGYRGFVSGSWMMKAGLTNDAKIIEHIAERSAAMGGLSKEQFLDSHKWMKGSGYYHVEGEVANVDNVYDTAKLFQSKAGQFLDKGMLFYRGGERVVRMSAWNAAYAEWAAKNAGKVLDNTSSAAVLARARMFGVDMTRASAAAWQQGVWSVPTQFMSYQIRMAEQFFGNRISHGDRLRMMAVNSTLYGVPVGVGTTVLGGQWPLYDDIRQAAIEHNLPINDLWLSSVMNGLPQAMMQAFGAPDQNWAQRYGPGGLSIWKDLLSVGEPGKKNFFEIAGGPSSSIIWDIVKSTYPVAASLYEVGSARGMDKAAWAVLTQDVLEATREISTFNNVMAGLVAMNTGKLYSKHGNEQADVTWMQGLLKAATGTAPMAVVDAYIKGDSLKVMTKLKNEAYRIYERRMKQSLEAAVAGDEDSARIYRNKAEAAVVMAGLNPLEQNQWTSRLLRSDVGTMVEKVDKRFSKVFNFMTNKEGQ